jgi:hypothetical protein
MTTENSSATPPSNEPATTVVSYNPDGTHTVTQEATGADTISLSAEDIAAIQAGETDISDKGDQDADHDAGEPDADESTEGEKEEADAEMADAEPLPDFEELTDEVASQYEGRYTTTDDTGEQVLKLEAFNAEFAIERPQEDGTVKRDLNPGTRKWLKKQFGATDALIDQHLAGVVLQEKAIADDFHSQFGADPVDGKANYEKMFNWAKKEGFTPAQKDRFNAAMQKGGDDAREQLELLKTRFITKNGPDALGKPTEEQKKAQLGLRREGRSASPRRSATAGKTAPIISAYANAEEHRVAQKEALSLRGAEREQALTDVRKRLEASQFWRRG